MTNYLHVAKYGVLCAIFLGLSGLPAQAQFWEKKDWKEWSKEECQKLLTDSPWARRFVITTEANLPASQVSRTVGESRPQAPQPLQQQQIEYIAQLRSARPIRQAVVRLSQIAANYDQMQPAQKQALDKQTDEYLNQDFGSHVVVHLYFGSNVEAIRKEMALQWRNELSDKVKSNTFLLDSRGGQVRFANYVPPEAGTQEFELVFPKQWEGKPTVVEGDRKIQIHLPGVAFREGRIEIDFDLRKMKYRGNLEY